MTESLFTSQTPSGANGSDGGAAGITTATGIVFAVNGTVSAIRFYATSTVVGGETYTAELWQATSPTAGTRPGSKTALGSAITAGTWNTITFTSPIAVTAGVPYYPSINNSAGRYVSSGAFFAAVGLTNGNVSAWQDGADPFALGAMRNGCFKDNSAPNVFPGLTSGSACYFADVVFTATGAPTDVAGVLAASLGSLTATLTGVREVSATGTAGVGPLTAVMSGVREVLGVASAPLGGLTAAMAGTRQVSGVLAAALGPLTASMVTVRAAGSGAPIVSQTATVQVVSQTTTRTFTSQTRGGVL